MPLPNNKKFSFSELRHFIRTGKVFLHWSSQRYDTKGVRH
ncbi:MAG: hypothetical protein K0R24_995 [Gammaproteobacteria bacterium]|jgi:hypothetical protein|nr:hypothetical protein [Gammaproteobacteria bacterium]